MKLIHAFGESQYYKMKLKDLIKPGTFLYYLDKETTHL